MLLVKTTLDKSTIDGVGLFAAEFIPAHTVIWRFHPAVDIKLTPEQIAELSPPCRQQIERYTYRERCSGKYVLCGDDARFFNHTAEPNCLDLQTDCEGITVAGRDINPGEELTCDYGLFDLDLIEGKYRI